jgi:hypothetical protein
MVLSSQEANPGIEGLEPLKSSDDLDSTSYFPISNQAPARN